MTDPGSRPEAFSIGPRVARAVQVGPYRRRTGDPLSRRLRVYASDPSAAQMDGAVAVVRVPYEPVAPGPAGALFVVDNADPGEGRRYRRVDLDDRDLLLNDGFDPSPSEPRAHQQMVYAVCTGLYHAFRDALGRDLAWGFDTARRLRIRPHAFEGRNAYYDKGAGEIAFGYFRAEREVSGRNLPGGIVFTCLSHDIVAHEMTHALVDGLRAHFTMPTGPDVLAFHEAFADLVAVLRHFTFEAVVQVALRRSRGRLDTQALAAVAQQFGETTGAGRALRTAVEGAGPDGAPRPYDAALGPHDLGAILLSAIYEAITTIYERRTERLFLLARSGIRELAAGELSSYLLEALAHEASKCARHFLGMCVRAIDYCPPVDLRFGEYLRALVTADTDLVPDDPWAYREALIDAFRRRHIYPADLQSLSQDALRWCGPIVPVPPVPGLSFAELHFDEDPGRPASEAEVLRQARALGDFATAPAHAAAFGLEPPDPARGVAPPCIESVRTLRRVGPDGQVGFDVVAEITQRRRAGTRSRGRFDFYGGSTIVVGPDGSVRYAVFKRAGNERRADEQRAFMDSPRGRAFWRRRDGLYTADDTPFRRLHDTVGGRRQPALPAAPPV
jgi:hypothetical protein